MKQFLTPAFLLLVMTAPAQSDTARNTKDSLFTDFIPYEKIRDMDTTGLGQYGIRIYDPRIGRYLPMDVSYRQSNPYRFTKKKPLVAKKKKPVNKPAPKK